MKTNFENRLKHQVEIILCIFVELGLQDHSLVSPNCNQKMSPISHTSGFGIKFKISIKRYFWDEFHFSNCYRRHPVTMLNRQKFQCRTVGNNVYRAVRTLYLDYVLTPEILGLNYFALLRRPISKSDCIKTFNTFESLIKIFGYLFGRRLVRRNYVIWHHLYRSIIGDFFKRGYLCSDCACARSGRPTEIK